MKNQVTEIFEYEEFDDVFLKKIENICKSIEQVGLDPYSQITGYLLTGNDRYITRTGDARTTISSLENDKIQAYVKTYFKNN